MLLFILHHPVLHLACRRLSVALVSFLLNEASVLLWIKDNYQCTPLHTAHWSNILLAHQQTHVYMHIIDDTTWNRAIYNCVQNNEIVMLNNLLDEDHTRQILFTTKPKCYHPSSQSHTQSCTNNEVESSSKVCQMKSKHH